MAIISKPGLPQGKVASVLLSVEETAGKASLEHLGINVITTQPCHMLPQPVACHPDMIFLHLKENKCVVIDKKSSFLSKVENVGFCVLEAENHYRPQYPHDVGLNCLILDNVVIGNTAYIDDRVKQELSGYEFVNVSQGYTKCSVCVVNENSLITEDESIYKALKNRFDVLKISNNCVELKGYDYGFFGGCTGLIEKNLLAVNGELRNHKSYHDIISFLKHRNVDFVELKAGDLTDIGSIIPLEEI